MATTSESESGKITPASARTWAARPGRPAPSSVVTPRPSIRLATWQDARRGASSVTRRPLDPFYLPFHWWPPVARARVATAATNGRPVGRSARQRLRASVAHTTYRYRPLVAIWSSRWSVVIDLMLALLKVCCVDEGAARTIVRLSR